MSTAEPSVTAVARAGLGPEQTRAIEALGRQYDDKRAACIEALQLVQRHYRWVCDEHLHEVARLLDMPVAELDGVATFYNLIHRRPVGRHVILLCDSVSCWLMGHDGVCDHLERRLGVRPGQTTPDGRFTLLPIVCLGHCDHAPAMMIDDDLHGDLDPATLDPLLDRYA